jgi:hypothetical protein
VGLLRLGGVVLLLAGLIVPMFGPMLGRNLGHAALGLTIAGLVAFAAGTIRRRSGEDGGAVDGSYGDATGPDTDLGRHDGHDGGQDGDGGH